jgi:hypothetical protein
MDAARSVGKGTRTMTAQSKTVRVHSFEGERRGIRTAKMFGREVQAVMIPRARLGAAVAIDGIQKCGVYILEKYDLETRELRVGRGYNCMEELIRHNRQDGNWSKAIVLVAPTGAFTPEHTAYLRDELVERMDGASELSSRVSVPVNQVKSERTVAEVEDALDTAVILLSTLDAQVFKFEDE